MITQLPEQLISQAEFLLGEAVPNEANVRRAVSAAYYALFHLLIRDAVSNWKQTDQHARLARTFDHKRMKDASNALLNEIRTAPRKKFLGEDTEQVARSRLLTVAEAFVDLQQARQKADYDLGESFGRSGALLDVGQARLAFITWAEVKDEPLAQQYLYSLLFKDR